MSVEREKRKAMLEQKVVSINEVRSEDGLEPASWGEFPAGSQQDVPFTGEILESSDAPRLESVAEMSERSRRAGPGPQGIGTPTPAPGR